MPEKVPKKNIDPVLIDIRRPDYHYVKASKKIETVDLTHVPQVPKNNFGSIKKITKWFFLVVGCALILFLAFVAFNLGGAKEIFLQGAEVVMNNFSSSIELLKDLKPGEAQQKLESNQSKLNELNRIFKNSYGETLFGVLGNIAPMFGGASTLLTDIVILNNDFSELTELLVKFEKKGFVYFQNDGPAFLEMIRNMREQIRVLTVEIEKIRNTTAELKKISSFFGRFEGAVSEQYLAHSSELYQLDKFLGGVLDVMSSGEEKHLLILFQNTAEIRPGGGFVGSYADVVIKNGQLIKIDVRDIYDPDGQLDIKVVPPQEIKTMTQNWGARDANWFFDFPTSAKTFLYFMESSKMYSKDGVVFDGVIGMNINVFESILDAIGPIPLEQYQLVIDKNNFLKEIQREVEAGEDKKAGEPKRILKVLAPIVLERLKNLPEENLRALIEKIGDHILYKDIMVYAKNSDIQNFLVSNGVGGGVYKLPNNFWGSYLAVVNANVAGGKTDVFMDELIDARIDLDTSGGIFTDLTIERTHRGHEEKDPWWKTANKNFIQIYTNPSTDLVTLGGNDVKTVVSKFDYDDSEYTRLPELENIDGTKVYIPQYQSWSGNAFGKSVFGTWFNINPGKSKVLNLRYHLAGTEETEVSDGKIYTFIFERQSGVKNKLRVTVSAPLGYEFLESESPMFIYETDNPEGRVQFTATIVKNR